MVVQVVRAVIAPPASTPTTTAPPVMRAGTMSVPGIDVIFHPARGVGAFIARDLTDDRPPDQAFVRSYIDARRVSPGSRSHCLCPVRRFCMSRGLAGGRTRPRAGRDRSETPYPAKPRPC